MDLSPIGLSKSQRMGPTSAATILLSIKRALTRPSLHSFRTKRMEAYLVLHAAQGRKGWWHCSQELCRQFRSRWHGFTSSSLIKHERA